MSLGTSTVLQSIERPAMDGEELGWRNIGWNWLWFVLLIGSPECRKKEKEWKKINFSPICCE